MANHTFHHCGHFFESEETVNACPACGVDCSALVQAKPSDFRFGALLMVKDYGSKLRVLNNSRGTQYDAVQEIGGEVEISSSEAHCYFLLEDGSQFKPTKEFMALIRTYG